jgi:hypothetical protein
MKRVTRAPGVPLFFHVVAPPEGPEILFLPLQGIPGDMVLWLRLAPADFPLLLSGVPSIRGEVLDFDSRGVVNAWVMDCVGGLADFRSTEPEVTVEAVPGTGAYYQDLGGSSNLDVGGGGISWLINLAPNTTSLTVRRSGSEIAKAQIPIRPRAITMVTVNYPQFM